MTYRKRVKKSLKYRPAKQSITRSVNALTHVFKQPKRISLRPDERESMNLKSSAAKRTGSGINLP